MAAVTWYDSRVGSSKSCDVDVALGSERNDTEFAEQTLRGRFDGNDLKT